MLRINQRIEIPHDEFRWSYARSSGPGGQNVNKVSSKATLHWSVATSPSLPQDVRARFRARFGHRINKQGELVLQSQRYRDQARNLEDCLDKLRGMILEVASPPKPRKATRPSRGAKERRLRAKRESSDRKQSRRSPHGED
jgi:ribosome-associated protein